MAAITDSVTANVKAVLTEWEAAWNAADMTAMWQLATDDIHWVNVVGQTVSVAEPEHIVTVPGHCVVVAGQTVNAPLPEHCVAVGGHCVETAGQSVVTLGHVVYLCHDGQMVTR